MGDESEASTSFTSSESSTNTAPTQFDDVTWQAHCDIIRDCHNHKHAPWIPGADWEFTPQFGITHICNCELCAKYKEHLVIAEAINGATVSSAWKICDQFEEKLVRLGWDLAHEGGQLPHTMVDAITVLESRNHQLKLQLAALHRVSQVTAIQNKELLEALDHERLDNSLREGEINFLQDECKYLQMRCTELKEQLTNNQQNILSLSKDEDVQMRSKTPNVDTSTQSGHVESLFTPSVGVTPRANPTWLCCPENFPRDPSHLSDDAVAHLAAA